jgi:hypothetical protein
MQDANLAATEINKQCQPTQPEAPKIAEYHLDRYFEMVEAKLNHRRKLYGRRPKHRIGTAS